jgi:septal ring factor EnvC (AmiA/AmiB activator)
MEVQPMNMAIAYSRLTVPQLKEMLGAARISHRRELEETKSKWAAEVSALREAASKHLATLTAELQSQKSHSAALQRELNAVHVELEKANAVIVEQGRKLTAHSEIAELEKRLQIARRMAS